MKKLLLIFLIFQSALVFSQNKALILTKEQNTEWFEKLKASRIESQLKMIKARILNDTNIFIKPVFPDGMRSGRSPKLNSLSKNKIAGLFRVEYIFFYNQKQILPIIFNNSFKTQKIIAITNLINEKNFTEIKTLQGIDAAALYGSKGANGVIMLKTNNNEVLNKLKLIVFGRLN